MAEPEPITPAQIVERNLNEIKPGEDEQNKRVRRYDRAYDVYRASDPRPPDLEQWQSNLRVKYGMQVIDTAMVNLAQGDPRCLVEPRGPEDEERAKGFQHIFDYYCGRDHLGDKNPPVIQQGLIYGITGGKNHWLYREVDRVTRRMNPATGSLEAGVEKIVEYDGPSFEPWDAYDMWWDPSGRDVDTCAYVVLRSWPSKDDLERNACTTPGSHDATECDGLYHNVDQLIALGAMKRKPQTAQDRFLTGGAPLLERYELLEVWRDTRLTVIGNRQVLMRDVPNPHWHGRKPIVITNTRPDLFKMQGIPETELVDHLQQALHTIQNMRTDNLHLTVMRGVTVRMGSMTDESKLVIRPRAVIPVADHDDYQPIAIPPLPREAYEEEANLLGRLQYVTGINPYISGSEQTGIANQGTATGINLLTEAASRLLQFKGRQVMKGIWQRTFEQWGPDIQQFMDKPLYVRITGPNGEKSWAQYGQQDVVGDYDFRYRGVDEDLSQAKERSDAVALLQALSPFAPLGIIDWKPIMERVSRAYGFENPDALVHAQAQQQAPPAAPTPPNGSSTPVLSGRMMGGMPAQAMTNGGQ